MLACTSCYGEVEVIEGETSKQQGLLVAIRQRRFPHLPSNVSESFDLLSRPKSQRQYSPSIPPFNQNMSQHTLSFHRNQIMSTYCHPPRLIFEADILTLAHPSTLFDCCPDGDKFKIFLVTSYHVDDDVPSHKAILMVNLKQDQTNDTNNLEYINMDAMMVVYLYRWLRVILRDGSLLAMMNFYQL